jgi:D-alanyl-D-alanine carboxypeptidase (penicillin-binding protein 5/6)
MRKLSYLLLLCGCNALPSLRADTPPPPDIKGTSVIVVNPQTDEVLYERNAHEKRQIGSTQKLLTSLIVAERGNLEKPVVIDPADETAEPTSLHLKPGTSYPRSTLLTALLVKSPNDVAFALGRDSAGSIEAFAQVMNAKAASLGATSSHFVNPNGLPSDEQYSTAADLSLIARAAYANPILRPIMATKYLPFQYTDGRVHLLRNTNQTMRENWFCTGMKTGYTDKAKHCLVSSGSVGDREAICIILGSSKERVFSDSARMLRWALGLPQENASTHTRAQRKPSPSPVATPEASPTPKKHHRHRHHLQTNQN